MKGLMLHCGADAEALKPTNTANNAVQRNWDRTINTTRMLDGVRV